MLFLMVMGSGPLAMIDDLTLKPNSDFPQALESISYSTNLFIKYGALHLLFFGVELIYDKETAARHIGQRFTTLWMQMFEHHRWGQHFHMQVETLLQVVDSLQHRKEKYPVYSRMFLIMIGFVMCLTNLITSIGYHTWREQLIGALLALLKVFLFDYSNSSSWVNYRVGFCFTNKRQIIIGLGFVCFLSAACTVLRLNGIWPLTQPQIFTSCFYFGCELVEYLLTTA